MYNLYSISRTPKHDVLLVRRLHSMSPALLPSGHWFEPHILHNESASVRAVPGLKLRASGLAGPCRADRLTIYTRRCGL
jgi:hypothetical protein